MSRPDRPEFRIAHLTDSHHRVGDLQLPRAVEAVRSLDPLPDLVVHGGDVVNGYVPEADLDRQMAEASAILARLPMPTMVLCDNHDTHGEAVKGAAFARHFHDRWVQAFDAPGLHVLGVSADVDLPGNLPVGPEEADGTWRETQPWFLRILEERLNSRPGVTQLVFTHVPVFPVRWGLSRADPEGKAPPGNLDNYALPEPRRSEVAALFARKGVRAHFAGHLHVNGRTDRDGVSYVVTSAVQSFPGEVRIVDLHADRIHTWMLPVEGGRDIWVRWRNTIDVTHPTVESFYAGQPEERDFVIAC